MDILDRIGDLILIEILQYVSAVFFLGGSFNEAAALTLRKFDSFRPSNSNTTPRFNEAAALTPRKWLLNTPGGVIELSFNEAAALTPRK